MSAAIAAVWNALTTLREEAERYTLHTKPDDLPTVRSARLAAAALEYAAAHLEEQQPNNVQGATLRRWAVEFRNG